ncbi:MAG: septation protein IspZ [Candidatus Paceibacterota bacterium]
MNKTSLFTKQTFKRLLVGTLLEFGPIFVFLLSFHHFRIYEATIVLMITTIISTVVTYKVQKRLPYLALYVAFLTMLFGYLTIAHHQPKFIQMRDTLYDVTCALTLLIGLMINVPFLKLAFHEVLPMTNRAWTRLTYTWITFFIFTAMGNEYVRRTMTLKEWFDFKSVVVILTALCGALALYFLYEKAGEK